MNAQAILSPQIWPYRVPFRQPFASGHGITTTREGVVVVLPLADGTVGYGEGVVLPEFGTDLLGAVVDRARSLAAACTGLTLDQARQALGMPGPGDVAAIALSGALHDALARVRRVPLHQLLAPEVPPQPVPVNATIGVDDPATAAALAQAAEVAGFRAVKLKVGPLRDPAGALARIARVRAALGPAVALRLDANASWTFAQAAQFIPRLAEQGVDLVEQPVPRDDLAGLRALRGQGVRIAADEAVLIADPVALADLADVIVLKPGLLGIDRAWQLASAAAQRGQGIIVTSCLESGIGVATALQLAAALPGPRLACGLATLDLLVDDLIAEPLVMRAGALALPAGLGIGVALDAAAAHHYGADVG